MRGSIALEYGRPYLKGRPEAPKGDDWDAAVAHWKTLVTDPGATFDEEIVLDASEMTPFVTWGTNPGQGVPLGAAVPSPEDFDDEGDQIAADPKAVAKLADKTIVLYCDTGTTTAAAQRTLAQAGIKNVYSLRGGLAAWKQENLPVVKG